MLNFQNYINPMHNKGLNEGMKLARYKEHTFFLHAIQSGCCLVTY